MHILGATGSGKSELMARMILADANAGRGLVVVDPKGDLITDVLTRLPARLGERVALFDADSRARPPILNPLEGADTGRTVDHLVSIFSRVYAASWGPRTEDVLRSGLLTLRAIPGTPTLADLPKLLAVPAFRQRALDQIDDDVLLGFWKWYDELSDASRSQVVAPLMNKIRGLLLRPFVHAAIAGGPSTIDMDTVLDGGICLVRISKGALGIDTARLIGSIVVARAWQAATNRARIPQRQRHDAALYIDECHSFLNLAYPIEDMLAEARGYHMSIVLAHQYLRQLPRELAEGISSNARTKIIFNASPRTLETSPGTPSHDCLNMTSPTWAPFTSQHGSSWLAKKQHPSPHAPRNCPKPYRDAPGRSANSPASTPAPASPPSTVAALPVRPAVDPRRAA
ncbi:type IV secretory system conjugative DNA transfer family protein [Prauserella oleivorans]